jgi:hypothetical protein
MIKSAKKRATRFEALQAKAAALGGRLTKREAMVTPWGWKKTKYHFYGKDIGEFEFETLREVEKELNDIEKVIGNRRK